PCAYDNIIALFVISRRTDFDDSAIVARCRNSGRGRMYRRTLLGSALLAVVTRPLIWPRWISAAPAGDRNWRHGVSFFHDLKYPVGVGNFEYVNPDSPKGGTAQQIALGTFDNFNSVVAGVKGSLAAGVDLMYETLLVSSLDEVSSGYGLLAEDAGVRLQHQARKIPGSPRA